MPTFGLWKPVYTKASVSISSESVWTREDLCGRVERAGIGCSDLEAQKIELRYDDDAGNRSHDVH